MIEGADDKLPTDDEGDHAPANSSDDAAASFGRETLEYLSSIALDAYDRQDDLNESVWRSLPFFAAALALAVTLLGRAAGHMPLLGSDWLSVTSNGLLWLSSLSFAWAFRWLWAVLRSRDYSYPSSYQDVQAYAEQMREYHATGDVGGDQLDSKVADELRLFRANQLGAAAQVNFLANGHRLKARSQLLLFMMIGFLLVIAAESIIYMYGLIAGNV